MSKHAFVFPGQGAQFSGMGKQLYESSAEARELFEQANEILGFRISDIMFDGSEEDLRQTRVTQPAVFLHSYVAYKVLATAEPQMVAGHSLGEFTALVANKCLSFKDGLYLVKARARAMQHATEREPGTMAAILGLDDKIVEQVCDAIEEVVVAANYNCPGQLVISGSVKGIEEACVKLCHTGMPGVPKCGSTCGAQAGRNKNQPDSPADGPRTLDTKCTSHDSRWRQPLYRMWPRQSAARAGIKN
ncbi:MAG: ACP S-malonyltransferase [Chitinophagaceae bacterium]|nr:ACP S-malonyltransferase [Chitinophagaceae bacterium]